MASDLLTLNDYLAASGKAAGDQDPQDLAQIQWAITGASAAIRQYIDRDVTLATDATPGPRTFRYLGTHSLEIDDCTAINSISMHPTAWTLASRTLLPTEYVPSPTSFNLPVFDSVELLTLLPFGDSPAMGFNWNADVWAREYGTRRVPIFVDVDAVWGWPTIPPDVKQAVIWTMGEFMIPDTPYISESIQGYTRTLERSRSGGGQAGSTPSAATTSIPARAQALLDPYVRVNV